MGDTISVAAEHRGQPPGRDPASSTDSRRREMTTEMQARIEALSTEAGQAGDLEMVAICERALAGDTAAIAECVRVLAEAEGGAR